MITAAICVPQNPNHPTILSNQPLRTEIAQRLSHDFSDIV